MRRNRSAGNLHTTNRLIPEYSSVFISYGDPDRTVARRVYLWLKRNGIEVFFFPESAVPGMRLGRAMSAAIYSHERVLLLCSRHSLDRAGVQYEIEQVLEREASEGGTELLIPLAIDDYVFTKWQPARHDLKRQVLSRVAASLSERSFEDAMRRVLSTLRRGDGGATARHSRS